MRDEMTAPAVAAPEMNEALPAAHWEQEKEKLTLALTERLLRGRDHVAFAELKKAPIFLERGIRQTGEIALALLQRQARQIIRLEKPLVLQSQRRFELEDDEVRAQLRRLRDLLAERLVFEKSEVQAALTFAVRLQFDLLTKPRAAVEALLASHSPRREKKDLLVILEGLAEASRLVAALQNLLAAFPGATITQEELAGLCRRAADEIYGAQPIPAVLADLEAYQLFCASLEPPASARIAQSTVLQMLHERGLHELLEKARPDLSQQRWWSIADLAPVLERALARPSLPVPASAPVTETILSKAVQESARQIENLLAASPAKQNEKNEAPEPPPVVAPVVNLAEAAEPAIAAPPVSVNGKNENAAAIAPVEIPAPASATPEIPPPLESEFEEVDLQAVLQVEEVTIPPAATGYRDAPAEETLMITRAELEAQPPGPYPSITRLIDGKSRMAFIKKVFHKDLDAYLGFIEALEATPTWKEAKALLDGTFKQRKVNPYSKEAVHLSDLVFSRYFTRGKK